MKIYYNSLNKDLEVAETVLFTGNGNIGLRSNLFEEYYDEFITSRETYINGFYETSSVTYPEAAYGFTNKNETMVSVVDMQTVHIYIDNVKINYNNVNYQEHERYLDIENGIYVRSFIVEINGKRTKIIQKRITSFVDYNICIEQFEFVRFDHNQQIDLVNDINFEPIKSIDKSDPRVSHLNVNLNLDEIDLTKQKIKFSTTKSMKEMNLFYKYNIEISEIIQNKEKISNKFSGVGNKFVKVSCYSKDNSSDFSTDFDRYSIEQKEYLEKFWKESKVEIDSVKDIEENVNYGLYALLSSVGRNNTTSISAKGLSSNGYDGHYFWDSEMYVFPFFLYTNPEIARSMLMYRINLLDKAIDNRKMIGYEEGALYAWRTISGDECSAFFEAGMAQHHINADIAYAICSYVDVTNDISLLSDGGYDVLLQTAKFYRSICYKRNGKYHIDKVTGPDEYTTLVNDNFYTNKMVCHHFKKLYNYSSKYNFELLDAKEYQDMSENMYLGFNEKLSIYEQDRDFLNKQKWPYNSEGKHPLLLHYHPLEIYRYQVCKQADCVLGLMLHYSDFSKEIIKNTVNYYDQVTTHDSSLSYSSFSTIYAKLNKMDKAYDYFMKNCKLDLVNLHNNTKDGIHTASMGGTYYTILFGFLGLEFKDNNIIINANLPKEITRIKMPIKYQNKSYILEANQKGSTIKIM